MPHPQVLPSYRKHKQSGNAIVTFRLPSGKRKDYMLGPYGSKESQAEYARLLGEFQAGHGTLPGPAGPAGDITVNELLVRYLRHCDQYYRSADGTPAGQAESLRHALRFLTKMYGHAQARNFGPLALKAVRTSMVEAGNSRKTVNVRVGMVRQFFKWCVAEELVPSSVYEGLRAVPGLRPGRTEAAERKPVRPAEAALVEAAIPFMPPPVAALVQHQLFSRARGGELLRLQGADIVRSTAVWVYRPPQHKNAWRSRQREIYFGPKAQEVLQPWIEKVPEGPLFSPVAAELQRNAVKSAARRTPRWPSHVRHSASRRARRSAPTIAVALLHLRCVPASDRTGLRTGIPIAGSPTAQANIGVKRASPGETPEEWRERIGPAGVAEAREWRASHTWTPHRLRHTAGTAIRREYGIELARIILGHSNAFTTEVYAEADREQAREVVAKIG